LWCRRFLTASIQGLSPCRSQAVGLNGRTILLAHIRCQSAPIGFVNVRKAQQIVHVPSG
jgi:hypothetical protein